MSSVMREKTTSLAAIGAVALLLAAPGPVRGEVRVQDIAYLQGQRTNKLMGYGLVVGLNGTGDGGKNQHTMRALMAMHRRFHQPALSTDELKNADNVAIVTVEVTIPEYGAREGQRLDVVVSSFAAKSLAGGQLLTTPLQFAMFDENDPGTQEILAFAGGRIDLVDKDVPTRGIVRGGCTLERDFFYSFILDGRITLVLDDAHASFQWAQLVARAINHELRNPAAQDYLNRNRHRRRVVDTVFAEAIGPKNVVVRIPQPELARPAGFISRVLQTEVFMTPRQAARVCINRVNHAITVTGAATISPTVVTLPGLGTLAIGTGADDKGKRKRPAGDVPFEEFLKTLNNLQLGPQQMVEVVEQLHRTGTLHAQLIYTE